MTHYNMSYQSVNGPSCSYAKLKTYANCARSETKPAAPVAVAAPAPAPVAVAAPAPAPVAAAPVAAARSAPTAVATPEGYRMERFLDPSVDSLPGNANSGLKNYTPSYKVPNYPAITTNALVSAEATCGGYKKILGAYGGMSGSSCTTNYINN